MVTVRFIMTRFGRLMAFVGLAIWAVGTVWAGLTGDADLFHRFGALGVAASVLFFSDRLLKIELGRQRSVERLLHEYGVELAEMKRGTPPTDLPKEGYAVDFLTEERNFGALRRQADLFNVANTVFLTIATLQWGFGDRVINRLIVCGGGQC